MKVINCPLNGPRNVSEFVYGGELKRMPDPARCTDREWAEYVFYDYNGTGWPGSGGSMCRPATGSSLNVTASAGRSSRHMIRPPWISPSFLHPFLPLWR